MSAMENPITHNQAGVPQQDDLEQTVAIRNEAVMHFGNIADILLADQPLIHPMGELAHKIDLIKRWVDWEIGQGPKEQPNPF